MYGHEQGDRESIGMTVVSARSIITLGNAQPEQMREALEVLKNERDSDYQVLGVRQNPYDVGMMESAEAKIAWNGVVRANQYERKVEQHNMTIRESIEEEERLHELGLRAKAELSAAQARVEDTISPNVLTVQYSKILSNV